MARIIREIDRGTRTIDNTAVTLTELVSEHGSRSFDAHLADGTLLTELACFDAAPDDAQLLGLLDEHRGRWRCPGCRTGVAATEQDLVADHLRDCTGPQAGPV